MSTQVFSVKGLAVARTVQGLATSEESVIVFDKYRLHCNLQGLGKIFAYA